MPVIIGISGKDFIGQSFSRRVNLYLTMGIKKIPVLELMELAEHFIPVAAINNRVGIGKIRIIVILCIDTSVVILFPVNIMGQIKGFILRRLQYGEADIRAGDFQPGISLRIDLLQAAISVLSPALLKSSREVSAGAVLSSGWTAVLPQPASTAESKIRVVSNRQFFFRIILFLPLSYNVLWGFYCGTSL